jgi:beta-N-acetylhexosaminidase
MTIEERIGQLLFIGIPGTTVDEDTRRLLDEVRPGGVVLFDRNIESAQQVAELNAAIRAHVSILPLISIDQEGGRVDRLKKITTPSPSAASVCRGDDTGLAARHGELTAELLRVLGFNMNFAPVLDLEVHPEAENALRSRYFGATTAEVIRFGGAYLEGLQRGGIVACGKHFPGLGDTTQDSHATLPTVERSAEQLRAEDLRPYTELTSRLSSRLNVIMVAHAFFPAFDGQERLPASISPSVVSTLLRDELEFRGLAISDDMEMGAISETFEFSEACVRAVEAGEDMILVCQTTDRVREAFEALVRAARDNRITANRRKRGLDRIARIKAELSTPLTFTETTFVRIQERIAALSSQIARLAG